MAKQERLDSITPSESRADSGGAAEEQKAPRDGKPTKGLRYGMIITALCVTSCLVALEGTVVSTALPTIAKELGSGSTYLWVVNAFFLSCTAFQPLYGQSANVFGRRWLTISAVSLFMLGSGISGGAVNMPMLIAGRTIQGIGGGGCQMLIDLIISDLVPVRERGSVMGYIFGAATIFTALGPIIGGAFVENVSWRWVFYINLPIAAVALVLLIIFLKMENNANGTWMDLLKRVDIEGNIIFVGATVSILIALTNAGTQDPWSSWRIIVPLALGFFGLALFFIYEQTPFCVEPTLPARLLTNRTSGAAFFLTFVHMMLLYWTVYFLPVYFQAVKDASPIRSGVMLLPTVCMLMLFAGIGGGVMEKTGRFLEVHAAGFGLMALGLGLFILLDETSSTAEWVIFQVIFAAGAGLPIGVLLPVAQGALHEKDTAVATGTWAVLRSFGTIWGVTIAAAAFNNRVVNHLGHIDDPSVQDSLLDGYAYEHATKAFVSQLNPTIRDEVVDGFNISIRLGWEIATGIAALAFLIVFVQRKIKLRTELETEFGLIPEPRKNSSKDANEKELSGQSRNPEDAAANDDEFSKTIYTRTQTEATDGITSTITYEVHRNNEPR